MIWQIKHWNKKTTNSFLCENFIWKIKNNPFCFTQKNQKHSLMFFSNVACIWNRDIDIYVRSEGHSHWHSLPSPLSMIFFGWFQLVILCVFSVPSSFPLSLPVSVAALPPTLPAPHSNETLQPQGENSFLQATVAKLGPLPRILGDISRSHSAPTPVQHQLHRFHSSTHNIIGSQLSGLHCFLEDPGKRWLIRKLSWLSLDLDPVLYSPC